MKTKVKTVYYCEYCGRHRLTSYSIKNKPTHLVVATALRNAIKQVEEVHSDDV